MGMIVPMRQFAADWGCLAWRAGASRRVVEQQWG